MRKKWPQNEQELYDRLLSDVPSSNLMECVRSALRVRGYWKNRPRGAPSAEYFGTVEKPERRYRDSDNLGDDW